MAKQEIIHVIKKEFNYDFVIISHLLFGSLLLIILLTVFGLGLVGLEIMKVPYLLKIAYVLVAGLFTIVQYGRVLHFEKEELYTNVIRHEIRKAR